MKWINQPWQRVQKTDENGENIPNQYEEGYYFKDDVREDSTYEMSHACGGVDIMYDDISLWIIDFWGDYKYLDKIFTKHYCHAYYSLEEAQQMADKFLHRIFNLKAFL